jgi:hypothetical protein
MTNRLGSQSMQEAGVYIDRLVLSREYASFFTVVTGTSVLGDINHYSAEHSSKP